MKYFTTSPFLLQCLMPPGLVWKKHGKEKTIYITFDDGPTPELTGQILQILKDHNAKATFFCVGENVQRHPELYAQILAGGHRTGNHTFHHLNGWKSAVDEYLKDVERCAEVVNSDLFRPPHGRITRAQARSLKKNYQLIMWSVLSGDFDPFITKERVLKNLLHNIFPGAIVVLHDNLKAGERMMFALPRFLVRCKQLGYGFEVL